jgi:hypothetical protein
MNFVKELVAFVGVLLLTVFVVAPFNATTGVARLLAVTRATAVTMANTANVAVVFFVFIKIVTKLFFI